MVDTPVATFGLNEITGFLEEDGYTPGTAAFNDEKRRRYSPIMGTQEYEERSDWTGDRKQAS